MLNSTPWVSESFRPEIFADTIHVWRIMLPLSCTDIVNELQNYLSVEEQLGIEKLKFDADRHRSLIARGGLRDILARYLQKTPRNLCFHYNEHGKPYLECQSLHFNVSHSRDCILYAISRSAPVGIDVEYCEKDIDCVSIAKQFFQQNEYVRLLELSEKDRVLEFYRCWTRKEAILKAMGTGLSFPLNSSEVGWHLQEINPASGYVATVATARQYQALSLWDWSPY